MRTADLRSLEPSGTDATATRSVAPPAMPVAGAQRTRSGADDPAQAVADPKTVFTELCAALFAFLRRSDQRRKGEDYVRGLLEAPGRKSIRSMAAILGGRGTAQSLHHFICSSTWDWVPVRQSLAHYLVDTTPPAAWVLRPMVIPKAGQHSVGVGKYFSPADGQMLNAQQAIGLWTASEQFTGPINWRLHLPVAWFEEVQGDGRAALLAGAGSDQPSDCAIEAYMEAMSDWGLPARPVVVNLETTQTMPVVRALHSMGSRFVAKIGGNVPLTVDDPALTGYGASTLPARQIMHAARRLRRPVMWPGQSANGIRGTSLLASVRVREAPTADQAPASIRRGRRLLLWGVAEHGGSWPGELWLSDLGTTHPAALLRLSRLSAKVDHDFSTVSEQVGIRDYVGRSYAGWHRHITLASAAHAIAVRSAFSTWPLNRAS
ncbi:putative ISXo8 transposase [Microtetraspora sp. NBRC 13810]|uniref:IS701 family transposase n=1 Tax=Microtetraspora sp. NBRC 13810 TaxID=3030990 RepID=UPI0024A2B4AD|nr:transposase [Microtetraspora sp. NBRC 13810]GLW09394.1 putative ISXo8 transposase [Microtetraspora sp. NBRC 13810]